MLLRSTCLALCFALSLAPEALAADSGGANPAARQRYQRAAQAYSDGRFKDAIDLFLDAARLSPNPAFAYNIGLAYEQLGDAPNALRWFREYLRALPDAPDRAEIEPRIVAAEKHLRELGVQQVTVISSPEGATLTLDGRRVGVTPWTGEVSPGRHRASIELRGYADTETGFELPSDHAVDVSLVMLEDNGARTAAHRPTAAPPAGTARPPQEEQPWFERVKPLTWATLGVGTAGLAIAAGFEIARSSAEEDAKTGSTNLAGHDAYETAKSRETAARIAVGVGGSLLAVGGVLLYFDLSHSSKESKKAERESPRLRALGLGCGGGLCGANFRGAF
jgi:tetratricopeptide (TPR) repeat protein